MFTSARLHLTAWYLFIIMFISILFSFAFYQIAEDEVSRVVKVRELREQRLNNEFLQIHHLPPSLPSVQELNDAQTHLKILLIFINGIIFILAGGGGYFLAGRTLNPIKTMMDKQKRFITDASHEMRTPLTTLRSEIEVGLRDKKLSLKEARGLLESNLEEVMNLQLL